MVCEPRFFCTCFAPRQGVALRILLSRTPGQRPKRAQCTLLKVRKPCGRRGGHLAFHGSHRAVLGSGQRSTGQRVLGGGELLRCFWRLCAAFASAHGRAAVLASCHMASSSLAFVAMCGRQADPAKARRESAQDLAERHLPMAARGQRPPAIHCNRHRRGQLLMGRAPYEMSTLQPRWRCWWPACLLFCWRRACNLVQILCSGAEALGAW